MATYHYHLARRHIADDLHIMLFVKNCRCVGLFKVTAEFRESFCERYADGYGESRLFLYGLSNGVCYCFSVSEQFFAARDVQPALVYAETFHSVGKGRVDFKYLFGIFDVFVEMRLDKHEFGAFLLGFPNGFGGLYAGLFCKLIFGKDYAVSCLRISANGKWHPVVFGMQFLFHRCVEIIKVAMQNCSSHDLIIYDFVLQNKRF